MISKSFWHQSLLATTAVGIGLTAVYSILNSEVGNRSIAEFSFPSAIPLANWQQLDNGTVPLEPPAKLKEQIQTGNRYLYRDGSTELAISMYYLTNTRGDVDGLLAQYADMGSEDWQLGEILETDLGFYRLASDRKRTYITGCLNSQGTTTVSQRQFSTSLNNRQFDLELLLDWLLNRASIRDRRCLWVTISTPNQGATLFELTEVLLPAWHSWLTWWQPRFPSL